MTFEEELLTNLNDLIESGDVIVENDSEKYFAQLGAMFPSCGSKIDWDKIQGSIEQDAKEDEFVESCSKFFTDMCERYRLSGRVIVIGDSAMKSALIMSIGVLKLCFNKLLELPQHHYIFPEDYSWCMSFTMEGDMAFGFKP